MHLWLLIRLTLRDGHGTEQLSTPKQQVGCQGGALSLAALCWPEGSPVSLWGLS